VFAGAALAAAVPALAFLLSDRPAELLVVEDEVLRVDAAVVMAGDPDYERTRTAAALVLAGRARLLVATGGEPGPGDSASSLVERAVALGVPRDRIRFEAQSRSTRESLEALRPLLAAEGVRTIALVTSPYHQRRAGLAARRSLPGVRVLNHPARGSVWSPAGWWRRPWPRRVVLLEYGKLAYYAARGWI
jgi:uncharacterized SAM-binding protein YcdF (DUF218 family)